MPESEPYPVGNIEMVYGAVARASALIAGVAEWWKVTEWSVPVVPARDAYNADDTA